MKDIRALTEIYKPKTFDDVIGHTSIMSFLRTLVSSRLIPQSQIFSGEWGVGKTVCSHIFAKAVNCLFPKQGSPCGTCLHCKDEYLFCKEFDSSFTGNVDFMRNFVSQLDYSYVPDGYFEFVILDEFHLASTQAQSSLLKVLETSLPKVKFLFCTTEVHSILDTIQSRALIHDFKTVSNDEIFDRLRFISRNENIEVSDDVLRKITNIANGHVRDAVKYLDYIRFGGTSDSLPSYDYTIFNDIFISIRDDLSVFKNKLSILVSYPLFYVKNCFFEFLEDLCRANALNDLSHPLLKVYSQLEINSLIKMLFEAWVVESITKSPHTVYGMLYYFYSLLSKKSHNDAVDWRSRLKRP